MQTYTSITQTIRIIFFHINEVDMHNLTVMKLSFHKEARVIQIKEDFNLH